VCNADLLVWGSASEQQQHLCVDSMIHVCDELTKDSDFVRAAYTTHSLYFIKA